MFRLNKVATIRLGKTNLKSLPGYGWLGDSTTALFKSHTIEVLLKPKWPDIYSQHRLKCLLVAVRFNFVFKLQWSWKTLIFITSRQEDRMVCPNKLKAAVRASRSVQARSCIHSKQWKMNPGSVLTEILHFDLVTWEKRFLPIYLRIPFYNTTHIWQYI
jgi:hypothetical protein